jgi:hypothetical protein
VDLPRPLKLLPEFARVPQRGRLPVGEGPTRIVDG